MKFIALEIPVASAAIESFTDARLEAEAARIWQLVQDGIVREVYYRGDRKSKVIVLECADLGEANHVIASLPLVGLGLIAFDVTALRPYPGFRRLFRAGPAPSKPVS